MPSPGQALAQDARRTRAGRWQMLLLALVCAAPVAASYFSYFVIRPQAHTNFGALIDPQRPLPALTATDLDGKPVPLTGLKGQWLLVSVAGGACDALCESNLYLQRQVREGLGKEKDRVDWVWLIDDEQPVRDALKPALHQATVLRVPEAALARGDGLAVLRGHLDADRSFELSRIDEEFQAAQWGRDEEADQAAEARRLSMISAERLWHLSRFG